MAHARKRWHKFKAKREWRNILFILTHQCGLKTAWDFFSLYRQESPIIPKRMFGLTYAFVLV